jgi:hypothetical protein
MVRLTLAAFALAVPIASAAMADAPEIVGARAEKSGAGWMIEVTLQHPDTGWDHYADAWGVFAPDGTELGERELMHPHENEQPFTRALAQVGVPDGVRELTIRAHCLVDGWSKETYTLVLP